MGRQYFRGRVVPEAPNTQGSEAGTQVRDLSEADGHLLFIFNSDIDAHPGYALAIKGLMTRYGHLYELDSIAAFHILEFLRNF